VEKDLRAAVQWYRHSASFGFPPAMDNLAACYERGDGVARDMMRSTVWKVRARAARGDRNAAAWLAQNGHSLR
jgi:TPR repeat protein